MGNCRDVGYAKCSALGRPVRILFVDFDGVLHSADAATAKYLGSEIRYSGRWLFSNLPLLEDLVARCPDVCLVLSTSWQCCYSSDELREFLGDVGNRVIGTTEEFISEDCLVANRFEECRAAAVALNAKTWAMVDDQPAIVWGNHIPTATEMAHVVFCDPVIGLTPSVIEALIHKLLPRIEGAD